MPAAVHCDHLTSVQSRPIRRLIAPILIVALGFCITCLYVLLEARRAVYERAGDAAASLAAAIESEVAHNIETLDLTLQAAIDNLRRPDIERMDPELRQLVLFDRSAAARHLGAILIIDESGKVRFDSRRQEVQPINLADRDYFHVHQHDSAAGLYISKPVESRLSGEWFVGLSRRLSHPDGRFAGVVVASLRLSYFHQLFKDVALGANGNITLGRTDGTILMRWPFKEEYVGLNLPNAKIFEHWKSSRAGRFETYAATDGVHRLFVYSQIVDLPLLVAIGQSTADIYADWNKFAILIGTMIALLSAMTILFSIYLVRELRLRRSAELHLAGLAITDGLTGLSNRRHFDSVLDTEWERAQRAALPIALLMIDADRFKQFNDVNGHQAGDDLLRLIARAISESAPNRRCCIARYGGDEFAVLLPGASAAQAQEMAESVRRRFAESCARNAVCGCALSIGIACDTPIVGSRYRDLLKYADMALYRAKKAGRDRIELEVSSLYNLTMGLRDNARAA